MIGFAHSSTRTWDSRSPRIAKSADRIETCPTTYSEIDKTRGFEISLPNRRQTDRLQSLMFRAAAASRVCPRPFVPRKPDFPDKGLFLHLQLYLAHSTEKDVAR